MNKKGTPFLFRRTGVRSRFRRWDNPPEPGAWGLCFDKDFLL